MKQPEVMCFLDIDVDGARAAYKLACDFVEATDLTYGWSSKKLVRAPPLRPLASAPVAHATHTVPFPQCCNSAVPCSGDPKHR